MRASAPLAAVASATSFAQHSVQELAALAELSVAERETLHDNGLDEIPVAERDLPGLVLEVLDELAAQGVDRGRCDAVVVTHSLTLTEAELAELGALLRHELPGLVGPPVFLTGRPCSVLHLGIELAVRRSARNLGPTLVLGGDLAPSVEDRFFFGSAMGDSAVGLVVGGTAGVDPLAEVLACRSTWQVLAGDGARSDPADIDRFRAQNPTAIRATIETTLRDGGLDWDSLTAVVPHTPYRAIWDTVATLCRFPRERILDTDLAQTGHLNSNDVAVHFAGALRHGRLRPGDTAALVSPGFGGTRGCTLVRVGEVG